MFNLFGKTDSQIQTDVLNELSWDPSVSPAKIKVSASEGIITLSGSVPHYSEKIMALQAAQRVGGVRAVADEIEVNLLGSYARTDEDIARAALSALEWNYKIPQGLKVTVEKGWITLQGEAEWDYERNAAKDAVSSLMGVRGVSNLISICSKIESSEVQKSIEDALKRSAEGEGRKIRVAVKGTTVTLSGKVDSHSEIEVAGSAAWSAPGVMMVENNLKLAH